MLHNYSWDLWLFAMVSVRPTRSPPKALFFFSWENCFHVIGRPSVDGGNGNDARRSACTKTSQKADGGKLQSAGGGKFQKTSVDEAFLEPTRRTLMAELLFSQQERKRHNATAGRSPATTEVAAASAASSLAGVKRPRGGEGYTSGDEPRLPDSSVLRWRYSGDDGFAAMVSRYGGTLSGSQDGESSGEGNGWDMAVGSDSLYKNGQPAQWARRTIGDCSRTKNDEGEVEDRLLEAGGLLGKRIQRTLRDVLEYDCSVGVAGNKVR